MDLKALTDRLDLDDLGTRYATAVDAKDWDLYRTCFTADATIDYTSAGGIRGGLDEIVTWLDKALGAFSNTLHYVTNRAVTLDGDTARGRLAYYNPMQLAGSTDRFLVATGYYNDRYVRSADGWRIQERVEELTWLTTQGPSPSS